MPTVKAGQYVVGIDVRVQQYNNFHNIVFYSLHSNDNIMLVFEVQNGKPILVYSNKKSISQATLTQDVLNGVLDLDSKLNDAEFVLYDFVGFGSFEARDDN